MFFNKRLFVRVREEEYRKIIQEIKKENKIIKTINNNIIKKQSNDNLESEISISDFIRICVIKELNRRISENGLHKQETGNVRVSGKKVKGR